MKQTFGLLYGAVAIHAVEIRRRLLAQFSGPRYGCRADSVFQASKIRKS